MTEKFKKAWADIEDAIGVCFLHKRAAFREVSGKGLQQLSLVTSAAPDVIRAFIGKRNVDDSQENRFIFAHDGIQIDLTSLADEEDLDKLYVKSFRHTLTIDSVGMKINGEISNMYHGVEDIENKVLRLTDEKATISEILFRRILQMVCSEEFKLDTNLKRRFEADKIFEKESYRKKYCEVLATELKSDKTNWKHVAELLEVPGGYIGHQRAIVDYTRRIPDGKDAEYKRTFAFLMFALLKVTSKEIQALYSGDPAVAYFDSLCNNLQKLVETYNDFRQLKEKYGPEFMEMLFDMQELWLGIENIPYTRPTERSFDRMALLAADKRYWGRTVKEPETKPDINKQEKKVVPPGVFEKSEEEEDEDTPALVGGPINIHAALTDEYVEENYDIEPTEGTVNDTYIPEGERELQKQHTVLSDGLDDFDSPISDDNEDDNKKSGFIASGLEAYENSAKGKVVTTDIPPRQKTTDSMFSRSKGHRMIMGDKK